MRPSRLFTVMMLCAATATSLGATTASAADVHTGRCDTPAHRFALGHRVSHLRTVVKTRQVWILHTGKSFGDEFFACWRPTGQARRIGFTSGGADITRTVLDSFTVNGHFVAFHIGADGDEHYDRFRSFDVRALRSVRDTGKVPGVALPPPAHRPTAVAVTSTGDGKVPGVALPPPAHRPTAVAVTSTGALAWLAAGTLHATDAGGTRVLADAAGGEITGLAAAGTSVSWSQAGQSRTVRLR